MFFLPQPEYLRLEQLSQEFAFELLGMCRNQSEVAAVLNDLGDSSEEEDLGSQAFEEGIPNLARLRLAVHYDQKRVSAGQASELGGLQPPLEPVLGKLPTRVLQGSFLTRDH